MKKWLSIVPFMLALGCAQSPAGETLRTVILIAAGVLAVVLLILFGRPKKAPVPENEQKPERK